MGFDAPFHRLHGFLGDGSRAFTRLTREAARHDAFGFGIEEEFFLADARTLQVAAETPEHLFEAAGSGIAGDVTREFLQAQVEAVSSQHTDFAEARDELVRLRQTIAAEAGKHGLAILACGTHPTARWRNVMETPADRYEAVMESLQMIGERNMLCGMHVHVELPDPDRRVEVMARMLPYIPLLLALSTSSPFWQSRPTGLKGYRLAAYDELPRTGLPELLRTNEEYQAYIDALVRSGAMPDASYIWWSIRPSYKHPTLELRAADCCTRIDDAIAIAALYRALARHLYFNRDHNADISTVTRAIAVENKWRAQRYGVDGTFATPTGAITVAAMLDQLIERITPDADALGCTAYLERCREIVATGSSADAQLKLFDAHMGEGHNPAFSAVLEWIAATTLRA